MQATGMLIAGAVFSFLLFTAMNSHAQDNTIHASIKGGGGDGKCTFEVEVDEVAEVEIRGDTGYLRTISGRPAIWRRLECNQPLPSAPDNFRFKGIDGRGRQELLRNPNSNRGVAVIRIEDPNGGREGYTGDIMWRGSSNTPDYTRDRYDRRDDRNGRMVSCSSDDGRRRYCDADTRGGVRLVRQRGSVACEKDFSWGYDDRGIWVDRGCRADFALDSGGAAASTGGGCVETVGNSEATRLADQCRQVSRGSRSACNVENSCNSMTDEIRRGCAQLGRDAPSFCTLYR
jgi:hypothetical protein